MFEVENIFILLESIWIGGIFIVYLDKLIISPVSILIKNLINELNLTFLFSPFPSYFNNFNTKMFLRTNVLNSRTMHLNISLGVRTDGHTDMARSTRLVMLIKNIYAIYRVGNAYFPTNLIFPFTLRVTGINTFE